MERSRILPYPLALAIASVLSIPAASTSADEQGGERNVVTVAFGAGLNTAQPGNSDNHHVLPEVIRVAPGDVVNFVVSGLHIIRAYDNGVGLRDVKLQVPDECEVNPPPDMEFPPQCGTGVPIVPTADLAVYYEGLDPLAPPPPPPPAGPPPFALPSTAVNRVEAVSFLEPGRYLVICAILPHFNDGMYAWVEVRGRDGGHGGGNGGDNSPGGGGGHGHYDVN